MNKTGLRDPQPAIAVIAALLIFGAGQNRIYASPLPGDFNLDGQSNLQDSAECTFALVNPAAYKTQHSLSNLDMLFLGDLNGDGTFNNQDINPFLQLVGAGSGPIDAHHPAMLY